MLDGTADAAVRLARQVSALRTARGETQKQLAERLGMTDSMISRLESGSHLPTVATLCRIAEGFGRRLDIVFHEHEHEHADGTRHTHAHRHDDDEHAHDHEASR
jgi:transcriptional regulator with XRE-family HTH domain